MATWIKHCYSVVHDTNSQRAERDAFSRFRSNPLEQGLATASLAHFPLAHASGSDLNDTPPTSTPANGISNTMARIIVSPF
jgi:hypothetical protein